MRTRADEGSSPKYAHIERERRWLVDIAARPDLANMPHVLIEDRYIDDTRCRLRRMTDSKTGEIARKLTKKYRAGDPRERAIVTAYLDEAEYIVFAALPANPVVKRRFKVPGAGLDWSVDRFEGSLAGLELVEIERDDDAALAALVPPDWLLREVTGELRYTGGSLAQHGLPKDYD